MKRLFFILFILAAQITLAQKSNSIGFACGYSGTPSKSVKEMNKLVESSNYNKIRRKINSRENASRCLAIIVSEILEEKGIIRLTQKEKKRILTTYNSNKKISVCAGCTYFNEMTLKEILNEIAVDEFGFNFKKIAREYYERQIINNKR